MKLDVNVLRYLGKDDFRVLTAVEMGQKNHEIVPSSLVDTIAGLKHGGTHKCLKELLRHKLVHHESKKYDGYRLTNMGYDFLAIKTLTARGTMSSVGRKIGVGKEADVYEVADDEGNRMCLKLHRLGRTSFRAVKSKRDYLRQGSHYSWLYLSRLSAVKEFAFMRALGARGLPVPQAIDQNRHAVLMSLVDAFPLVQIKELARPASIYTQLIDLMEKLAEMGLVHCDFNEFNILINEEEEITLIDFPQMVSTNHANAEELFERDVDCLIRFFSKKLGYVPSMDTNLKRVRPDFQLASPSLGDLDSELRASGFKREHQAALDSVAEEASGSEDEESDEESDDGEVEVEEEESASDTANASSASSAEAVSSSSGVEEEAAKVATTAPLHSSGPPPRQQQAEGAGPASGDEDDAASVSTAVTGMTSLRVSGRGSTTGPNSVADTLRQQQKKAARRAAMASASRNAMKGRNKGKRRGEGGGGDGGGITWG